MMFNKKLVNPAINRLRVIKNETLNIAQNQSFAQKGVGTNIKPYIYGPTRKILLVLAISTSI